MTPGPLFERWVKFNGVGALGVGVQLAVLGWLVRGVELHYLWATACAVEAAVLHNFCWHERWTWRDRPSRTAGGLATRLARFHLLNGAISLGGNLLLMRALTGVMHLDPLAANIFAILACSLLTFGASEWLVFRRGAVAALLLMAIEPVAASPAAAADSAAAAAMATTLRPQTIQAWTAYEQAVDARYFAAAPQPAAFFALDAFKTKNWRSAATTGVAMIRLERPRPGDGDISVPDGKIHHWAGAIFVPGVSVATVLDRLSRLAGSESRHYEDVAASRLISRDGDRYQIFMKLRRSKFGVDATFNTEHAVEYRRLGAARATARSVATRIAELENAGGPGEREKKPGADSGFLWRLNAYWRYEAVNDGVMIECESVSLSRGVPFLARPLVNPIVEGLARDSLERTLVGLRKALTVLR